MPLRENTVVLWNPRASRASEALLEELRAHLPGATICALAEGDDPTARARECLRTKPDAVVAAGGDGTVSAVAAALLELGEDAPALGVLPMGTSNSFSVALGIPADLHQAIAVLEAAETRTLDAAVVGSTAGRRTMVLHCMIGIHADTIASASDESKQRWGVLAYVGSALRQLASLSSFTTEIVTDGHEIRCAAIGVGVTNLAPARAMLAQGPSHHVPEDGLLDATIVAAESISEAVATTWHLYRSALEGEPANRDNVGSVASASLVIRTEPPQQVLLDGEAFGETPVEIAVIPGGLRVIAPPAPAIDAAPVDAPLEGLPELEVVARGDE
jgi:YegS/Rv2252/BmrU family lipid kinase